MSDHAHAAEHGHDHDPDDGAVHAHVSSLGFYVGIFAALICLTVITVAVSYLDLGTANLLVAIVVASIKASLVVLFFMHLKYDNKFNAIILIGSLLFIGVFFAYTMNDTDHRAQFDAAQGSRVLDSTGEPAPGGLAATEKELHPSEAAGEHGAGAAPGASPSAMPSQNHAPPGTTETHEAPHGGEHH